MMVMCVMTQHITTAQFINSWKNNRKKMSVYTAMIYSLLSVESASYLRSTQNRPWKSRKRWPLIILRSWRKKSMKCPFRRLTFIETSSQGRRRTEFTWKKKLRGSQIWLLRSRKLSRRNSWLRWVRTRRMNQRLKEVEHRRTRGQA